MKVCKALARLSAIALISVSLTMFSGCGNNETREAVDETVEELTGKKSLERMEQMKDDIQAIESQQQERTDRLEALAEE